MASTDPAVIAEQMAADLEAFADTDPADLTPEQRQQAMDAHTGLIALRIAERAEWAQYVEPHVADAVLGNRGAPAGRHAGG